MKNEEKKKIILDFINGPLRDYFEGDISFGRFKEKINEKFDTDFSYSDLYPSYLFNAKLSYEEELQNFRSDLAERQREYNEKLSQCHAYGLCITGEHSMFPCAACPTKNKG